MVLPLDEVHFYNIIVYIMFDMIAGPPALMNILGSIIMYTLDDFHQTLTAPQAQLEQVDII